MRVSGRLAEQDANLTRTCAEVQADLEAEPARPIAAVLDWAYQTEAPDFIAM
jgi:hypothetical protein